MSHAQGFDPGFKFMTGEVMARWKQHVRACYPREACAFVTDRGLMPVENICTDPDRFEVKPQDYIAAVAQGLHAFLHSHRVVVTNDSFHVSETPSEADQFAQLAMAKPWGISACDGENVTDPLWFGDQVPVAPLVGRVFIHGVWDCYSLIRDWYREHGILLKSYPRSDMWWMKEGGGPNFYANHEDAGFHRVPTSDIKRGDIFLCSIRSPKCFNHAGIYEGNGIIIHHMGGSLSQRTPAVRWQSKMDYIVRYKDPIPEAPHA